MRSRRATLVTGAPRFDPSSGALTEFKHGKHTRHPSKRRAKNNVAEAQTAGSNHRLAAGKVARWNRPAIVTITKQQVRALQQGKELFHTASIDGRSYCFPAHVVLEFLTADPTLAGILCLTVRHGCLRKGKNSVTVAQFATAQPSNGERPGKKCAKRTWSSPGHD